MKQQILMVGSVACLLLVSSTVAVADDPGKDWMPMDKVISILKENGYSQISEIEADDGRWEGEGMKNGERYEFHVDPHSGKLTKDERDSAD